MRTLWKRLPECTVRGAVVITILWALASACGSPTTTTDPGTTTTTEEIELAPGTYETVVVFENNQDRTDVATRESDGRVLFEFTHPECRTLVASLKDSATAFFSCFDADNQITGYGGETGWDGEETTGTASLTNLSSESIGLVWQFEKL